MFTGGSQFAFVGVIGAGGLAAAPAAIASAALLGVRNAAYGMRMSPVIGRGGWRARGRRPIHHRRVHGGLARADDPHARPSGSGSPGIAIYVGWNLSTLAGALLGDVLGDPRAYGLDAAAAAAFLALLWPRLRRRRADRRGGRGGGGGDDAHPGAHARAPVLIAAFVAIVVGWFNWLGSPGGAAEPTTCRAGGLP